MPEFNLNLIAARLEGLEETIKDSATFEKSVNAKIERSQTPGRAGRPA